MTRTTKNRLLRAGWTFPGIGPGDRNDPAKGSHLMHKAHDLWLASLRYASEP